MRAVDVVQRQFDAYNAQDIEAFCATYADDRIIALYGGERLQVGKMRSVRAIQKAGPTIRRTAPGRSAGSRTAMS